MARSGLALGWKMALGGAVLAAAVGGGLLYRRNSSVPYRLRQLRGEVAIQLRLGNLPEAIAAVEGVLRLDPGDLESAARLARLYQQARRVPEAERLLRAYLQRYSGNFSLQLQLASLLATSGRPGEAGALLLPRLGELDAHPDVRERSEAYILAGRLLAREGRVADATRALREAARLRQTYGLRERDTGDQRAVALLALAEVLIQASRWSEAEDVLREALDVAPDGRDVHVNLAAVLSQLGRAEEGRTLLWGFFRGAGRRRGEVVLPLTAALLEAGLLDEARRLADELAQVPEDEGLAGFVRGSAALTAGELAEARAQLARASERPDALLEARLLLARVALRQGDAQAAREALEAALTASPGLPEAELSLLELDETRGQLEAASERAARLLSDPRTRARAARSLLALGLARGELGDVIERCQVLAQAAPEDASLALFLALFRLVGGQPDRGAEELASVMARPGVDAGPTLELLGRVAEERPEALEALQAVERLANDKPALAPTRLLLSGLYLRFGRPDLARAQLDAALTAQPGLRSAREARARLALSQGDPAGALADLRALSDERPDDVALLRTVAGLEAQAGQVEVARSLLLRANQAAPEDGLVLADLARLEVRRGNLREALKAFLDARRLAPDQAATQQEGAVRLLLGEPEAAARAFERGYESTGAAGQAAAWCASLALAGRPAEALAALARWSAGGPLPPEGALLEALLLARSGDRERARARADASGAPTPVRQEALREAPRARQLEILALTATGWTEEARARARATGREAARADALEAWWALRTLPGDAPERLALSERLAALAPDDPSVALERVQALRGAGQAEQARALLTTLGERFPENPDVALRLGSALEAEGDPAGAAAAYSGAALATPPAPAALNNLAYLLSADPEHRSLALDYARAAVAAAPQSGAAQDTLGWILFLEERLNEASHHLSRAVGLAPADASARSHLARALDRQGETSTALAHLRVALLSKGGFPERAAAEALQSQLSEERAALDPDHPSWPLPAGGALDGTLEQGLAVFAAPAADPRLLRLRFRSRLEAPAVLLVAPGAGRPLRLEVPPQGSLELAQLRLGPGPVRLAVHAPGASGGFSLALEPVAADPGRAPEPDDLVAAAPALVAGQERRGELDGPADLDCARLSAPAPGVSLRLEAGPRYALGVELLREVGGLEQPVKSCRVEAGQSAVLEPLVGELVVRLRAASAPKPGAAGPDYRLLLGPAAAGGDVEPNDRPEVASPLAPGGEAHGRLGPVDAVDCYLLPTGAGDASLWELTLDAPAGTTLQLWERPVVGQPVLRQSRRVPPGQTHLVIPRWRVGTGNGLLALLLRGPQPGEQGYLFVARPAPPDGGGEEEPNDRPGLAQLLPDEVDLSGVLDPGERDWFRLAPRAAGARSLQLRGNARLQLFALEPGGPPRWVATWTVDGGLELPALRLPDGALIELSRAAPGDEPLPYALLLAPVEPAPGDEVEPNDDPARAASLTLPCRGFVSGREDRDLLRPAAAITRFTARAHGGALRLRWLPGGEEERLEPGQPRSLAWRGGPSALLEVSAAPGSAGGAWTLEPDGP